MPKLTLNDLPSDKLPDFWSDNQRINALYAPFRERSVNARDWDSKNNFWKGIIETWCDFNKFCTFTEAELKQSFIQNGRTPACLGVVLTEMHKNSELQTLEQFMIEPQKSWTGWAFDLAVRKPLSWSFNKVKSTIVAPTTPETIFVHKTSVKNQSEKLFQSLSPEHRNQVMPINDLLKLTNSQDISMATIKLLLHNLKCQNKIDTIEYQNAENESEKSVLMVKVAPVNGKLEPISSVDMGKYTLEENEKVLIKRIEDLEREKSTALENTKNYLRKGMKQMAKTCLKKEHEIGRRIDKQMSVLENVQTLLTRIGTAETDGKVLESYKFGLNALKTVFKDTGLSEDGVSDTMADLEEVMDTHDDIQTTLSQSLNATVDDDLEQELADLLAEPVDTNPNNPPSPGAKSDEEDEFTKRLNKLKMPIKPSEKNIEKIPSDIFLPEDDELTRRLNALKMPIVPTESPTNSPEKDITLA